MGRNPARSGSLPVAPYWSSNNLAYSASALALAGFGPTVATQLRTGAKQGDRYGGQVPHQLSPAGSPISVGNVQETPQFVSPVWDYYRWTGDRALLADVYPVVVEGIFEYNLDRADRDGDSYPEGVAMVERAGMGPEKLDAAAGALSSLPVADISVEEPPVEEINREVFCWGEDAADDYLAQEHPRECMSVGKSPGRAENSPNL